MAENKATSTLRSIVWQAKCIKNQNRINVTLYLKCNVHGTQRDVTTHVRQERDITLKDDVRKNGFAED